MSSGSAGFVCLFLNLQKGGLGQGAAGVAGSDECACCGADAPRGHDDAGACTAAQSSGGGILSNILSMFGMKQEL